MFNAKFLKILFDRQPRTYRIAFGCVVAFWVVIIAVLVKTGCSYQMDMAWDAILLLEGASRLVHGQIPHTDYLSAIGILPIAIISLGLLVCEGCADALALGPAIALVPFGLYVWWVARNRFSAPLAALFVAFVSALLVATRPLGFGLLPYDLEFAHTSYAMWYNRLGWSLLSVFMVQLFLTPLNCSKRKLFFDAVGAGVIAALLVLTKINYCVAAIGFAVVAFLINRRDYRNWVGFVVGAALIFVPLCAFTRFSLVAWKHELDTLGSLADLNERGLRAVFYVMNNITAITLLAGGFILVIPSFRAVGEEETAKVSPLFTLGIMTISAIGCGVAVLALNMQLTEEPLFPLISLITCEYAIRRARLEQRVSDWSKAALRPMLLLAVAGVLGSETFINDVGSVLWSCAYANHARAIVPAEAKIDSEQLGKLTMVPQRYEEVNITVAKKEITRIGKPGTPFKYALVVNDGLKILAPYAKERPRILTFDQFNPFPFALGVPYPKGGLLWWDANDFSLHVYPKAVALFADVTLVMVAKAPINDRINLVVIKKLYGKFLDANFDRVAESDFWELYRKKTTLTVPAASAG